MVLEHAVAAAAPGATPGQFGQFSGVRFSHDATRPSQVLAGDTADGVANVTRPGERVRNAAILDEAGNVVQELIRDGVLVGDPARPIRIVTINLLADEGPSVDGLGGDNYPIPSFDSNRVDLFDGQGNKLGEQQGFINYLTARSPVGGATIRFADTPASRDGRIQNLVLRADTVLTGALTPTVTPASITTAEDTNSGLIVITPNAANGAEVTHFFVTAIVGGSVFLANGTTPVADGGFVTASQGAAGLIFRPAPNYHGPAEITVRASVSGTQAGLGSITLAVPVTITPVNDAPTAANLTLTTAEDTPVSGKTVATDLDGDTLSFIFATTAPPLPHRGRRYRRDVLLHPAPELQRHRDFLPQCDRR